MNFYVHDTSYAGGLTVQIQFVCLAAVLCLIAARHSNEQYNDQFSLLHFVL